MEKQSTPMKSSGKSLNQNGEISQRRIAELEQENNYLLYQASLKDEVMFRDTLLRQIQIMNQNLIAIKEEIVKASSEGEPEDNRDTEQPKQSSYLDKVRSSLGKPSNKVQGKPITFEKDEEENEQEEDNTEEIDDDEEEEDLSKYNRPLVGAKKK